MYEEAVSGLIEELGRLPGIGPKSAQRIAFFVIQNPKYDPSGLGSLLQSIRSRVSYCDVCGMITSNTPCAICRDLSRDEQLLCVVEEAKDVWAIERTREYRGRYHVLGGALSPLDGVGPEELRIKPLMERLSDSDIREIILATDPNLEGEATASYLARLVAKPGLTVTRLASGLPVGGDLEYADEVTLGRAFAGRRAF